jgi:hypothetical protein
VGPVVDRVLDSVIDMETLLSLHCQLSSIGLFPGLAVLIANQRGAGIDV